ncbi:two-component system regulatory protein YycI [Microaerobacter geothermalis]|uniref:two-component system regulatory protein YycI n=1 Tax=Microaerobacter geothermalis TaxID=674972 RepID=UPI001F41DA38|nr:two-component system regulatory protein YycI [Microaerobacter geothermalis]MCF6094648.1 two-component system regulatory protein YycI [Microaerobacter geothermalis]
MDWSKAKSILIVAFLLLNIFLVYQNLNKEGILQKNLGQDELVSETLSLLQEKQIVITAPLPKENSPLPYLYVNMTNQEEKRVTIDKTLSSPTNVEEINKVLEEKIPWFKEYIYLPSLSTGQTLTYIQTFQQIPLFGAELNVFLKNNRITGYNQILYRVINIGEKRPTISYYMAIRTLVDNGIIGNKESITDIKLGYYGQVNNTDGVQVLVPVWRVTHDSGVHYINGITGGIEETSIKRSMVEETTR